MTAFDQSDDGIPELRGIGREMLGGQIDDIAQGVDGRLQRFHRDECRLPLFDGFLDLEAGDRAGFGDVGADQ